MVSDCFGSCESFIITNPPIIAKTAIAVKRIAFFIDLKRL